MEMRVAMSELRRAWCAYIQHFAGDHIPFKSPHCGVFIRRWKNTYEPTGWSPACISLECDPGYVGIGAALTAGEAYRLGDALLRAAKVAARVNATNMNSLPKDAE